MPITLITGPANAGKAQVVMDTLRRHLAHGEEPLLVVPTRADAEHYMRELAGDRVALGVRVERFEGLIWETVRRAGTGGSLLGGLARERVIAAIVARASDSAGAGGARAGTRARPGFVRALADVFAELQGRRVSAARLMGALSESAGADGAGAADGGWAAGGGLGRLYGEYRDTLERIGRVDGEQRAVRALDGLRRQPALWEGTPVLFYGFDDLTHLQIDAIETLGRIVGAPVTVSLTYEPGRTAFAGRAGTFAALAPLAAEHRRLAPRSDYYAPGARAALGHLERSLYEPDAGRMPADGAVRLLEGGGERAELELIAREIVGLLGDGMAPEEIAIVVRAPGATGELLEEVLTAAGIPHALQRRRRLADTALGGALIGLLRCLPGGSDTAEDAEEGGVGDLLAWLRAPGLLERPELADGLELRARRSGVRSAGRARGLWEERHWPLESIDRLAEAGRSGPVALIDRAERELQWLFCAPRRRQARVLAAEELDEARALAAGRRALGELRELARIAPELGPGGAGELASWLERVEIVSGQRATPGAVAVLDPLALRARRVRALFVCGLQEGVFPARPRPQPLLGAEERRRLAEISGLWLGEHDRAGAAEDTLAAERYLLYAAVSRPEELLVLSWHVSDDDGEPAARSLFVEDVCDLFDEDLLERRARRPLGAVDGGAAEARAPDGVGEDRAPDGAGEDRAPVPWRGSGRLGDERLLAELGEHVWSASSLEAWIGCPVRWFVERMLRPGALDPDPEPFARGGLAHAALRDTLEGLRAQTGSARVTPSSLPLARELLERALRDNEPDFRLSTAPERVPGVRRRLHVDLERYLSHAAAADSPLEPSALELGFGFAVDDERGQASDLPAFELGPNVRLRGRIDRVDTNGTGEAVVYDYKSRVAPPAARWIGEGNLQVGLYMRAVEGLLGVRAAGGFYQPLSGPDLRARGVLDGDSGVELECVRGEVRERAEVDELLGEAVAAALEAAAQAGRGELESRPRTCAYQGGCMYPAICRCER